MKRLFYILVLTLLACAGCRSDADSVESAAMELYHQYADNGQGITVAYIGDYKAYNQIFNAVMFHADDSAQWQWLKRNSASSNPATSRPVSTPKTA